jgi:transcriptional regulator with XRE-family HTH domain
MTQGQALRRIRTARGLSQTELARRSGIAQPTLSAMENGRESFGAHRAAALAAALHVAPSKLLWLPSLMHSKPAGRMAGSPVMLPNVAKRDWGWFSREDPRMHLQTLGEFREGKHRVRAWLELKGQRAFVPDKGIKEMTSKEWKEFEAAVREDRKHLEARWVKFMMQNSWISARLSGSTITVVAYPATHNQFARTIDLRRVFPGAYPYWEENPPVVDLDLKNGMLRVGPQEEDPDKRDHIALESYLWGKQ